MLFMVVIAPMSIYGYISKDSHMMTPFVYFVGICAMFFTALSYMKMSSRFPIAGSVYAYVQRGLNHHVGFIAGWLILLDYVFVPALLYLMTANWCVELFPHTRAGSGSSSSWHQHAHQRARHHLHGARRLDHVLC